MAYNISGSEGVELELFDGSPVMIGSNRSQELAAAIGTALKQSQRVEESWLCSRQVWNPWSPVGVIRN
jgi:hypothetical protein